DPPVFQPTGTSTPRPEHTPVTALTAVLRWPRPNRRPGGPMVRAELHTRRVEAVRAWTSFVENGDDVEVRVRPEILRTRTRSGRAITPDVTEAPLADEQDTRDYWLHSPLQVAVERVEDELRRTAEDGDLVIAITDPDTRILWTYGGRVMRRKAE